MRILVLKIRDTLKKFEASAASGLAVAARFYNFGQQLSDELAQPFQPFQTKKIKVGPFFPQIEILWT